MNYFPFFMDLRGRRCLVVGGSETAARKAELFLRAGARVDVVADDLDEAFRHIEGKERVSRIAGPFQPGMLDGVDAVIAAEGERARNEVVAVAARARHLPVNVVDTPDLCSFILPSIIDRSPLVVAVSSGGEAPVLARLLRARLETLIPAAYGRLGALAAKFKAAVREKILPSERRAFWEKVFQSPIAEMVYAGRDVEAERRLAELLEKDAGKKITQGEVYLVGAGPGNPDLLTFRALRLMQQADVVVHDRLVSQPILDMCRRDAERIYVGKERDDHALPQEQINLLLARLAKEGKRVLRLKGGDPYVFGRGAEEVLTLAEHGIPFRVIPGVTAGIGGLAEALIPATMRGVNQAFVLATGHGAEDGEVAGGIDWAALARLGQPIIFYMALTHIAAIVRLLIDAGMAADTPAAVVACATTPAQRVLVSTLAALPEAFAASELGTPAILVVGHIVAMRARLLSLLPELAEAAPWRAE